MRGRLLILLSLLCAAPAMAQRDPLAAAEAAYLEVDFEGTRNNALLALRAGGKTPEQVVRIYQLLGISSSALGDEDAARDYFVRMLGIDRDAALDESVPPRLRNPYLEARGVWAARQGRLEITAGLDRATSSVRIELTDPTDMARRVRVSTRLEGDAQYTTQEYAAAAVLGARMEGAAEADRVEYYVDVLDMHGNVILASGTPFSPRVVGRAPAGSTGGGGGGGGGGSFVEEPVLWIVVGAVLAVAAAVTIGVVVDQRSRIGFQSGVTIGVD